MSRIFSRAGPCNKGYEPYSFIKNSGKNSGRDKRYWVNFYLELVYE